jgi:hypothetical protein
MLRLTEDVASANSKGAPGKHNCDLPGLVPAVREVREWFGEFEDVLTKFGARG